MSRLASRNRHRSRRPHRDFPEHAVDIRVGSRRSVDQGQYLFLRVHGDDDANQFARLIEHTTRANPGDPILVLCTSYQPYLEDVLSSCLDDMHSQRKELHRETEFAETLRFPEYTYRRLQKGRQRVVLPYSFIIEQINLPDVYYWSFNHQSPLPDSDNPPVDDYRFRVGGWTCSQGSYHANPDLSVTVLFFKKSDTSDHVASELLFQFLYRDPDFVFHRDDEASVSYVFLRLFQLLTDWQNVIMEFEGHLEVGEQDSKGRKLTVKARTRTLHHQISRIWELLTYQRFHSSCFKKLIKMNPKKSDDDGGGGGGGGGGRSKAGSAAGGSDDDSDNEPVWDELDNQSDALDQVNYELTALQQRFDNLTELEFNIENAQQSADSRFLSILATLFLPLSYLASIWGITTFTASPKEYLWAAIPVFLASAIFIAVFQPTVRRIEKIRYPEEKRRLDMQPQMYTMLGADLPDAMNIPGAEAETRARRGKPRRRSQGAIMEKQDYDRDR